MTRQHDFSPRTQILTILVDFALFPPLFCARSLRVIAEGNHHMSSRTGAMLAVDDGYSFAGEVLAGVRRDSSHATGAERKLLAAILTDGVESYLAAFRPPFHYPQSSTYAVTDQPLHAESRAWVERSDDSYVFSFDMVCRALGIDPQYLRLGLMRCAAGMQTENTLTGRREYKRVRRSRNS